VKIRKILVGTAFVLLVVPMLLAAVAWMGFYGLLSWYAPNRTTGTIVSSGHDREYLLHVPKTYDGTKPTPLVITLHPAMNWPAFVAKLTRWNDVADENGFIVAYPAAAGHGPRAWLDGKPGLLMDVRFVSDLIDTLQASYNIDPARIYADGISQGGGVAFVLACRLSPRIAAVATVAAAYELPWWWCKPERPVPAIAFHGTADPVVLYKGGPSPVSPRDFPSIPEWSRTWAERNRCTGKTVETKVAPRATRLEYTGCADNASVVLFTLEGAGHQWPGSEPLPEWMVGPQGRGVDATREIWSFFRDHPLPPARAAR
jgi:polyhydroxybutyrate depolymerase